ncbi:MAG: FAD-dependent oxidoreductase [Arachnia sp.]
MKVIIVGGVAGGATAAARARRLDETAQIIVFERGEHVSFANCGLPYYIGGVIEKRSSLFVSSKAAIEGKYDLEVRDRSDVRSIDRDRKTVTVTDLRTGDSYEESYDKLVLSTGSSPFVPPMPGGEADNVFTLWTIPDTDAISAYIQAHAPRRATVVGAGFIGLEMVGNLAELGMEVTLVELMDQVMPPLDPDMAKLLSNQLVTQGVGLRLGVGVSQLRDDGHTVVLDDGSSFDTDLVLLSVGVRPNNQLAKDAGLELGPRGHVTVDEFQASSDPDIYAVGDVVEVSDPILGARTAIPLAGPANRQGRAVAANALGSSAPEPYAGSIGTSVTKVFDLTAAATGHSEKSLQRAGKVYGTDYHVALVHPMSHVGYYPGATPMTLKLIFGADGAVLGAQIVGFDGVDKRIDVIATSIHFRGSVTDLAQLELAYAPPYGAAKDPVNFAGMVAGNILSGLSRPVLFREYIEDPSRWQVLDVREPAETAGGMLPGAVNIALGELRGRLDELTTDTEYLVNCAVGLRGYLAERMLTQRGFKVRNLAGGWRTYAEQLADTDHPVPDRVEPRTTQDVTRPS